MSEYDCDKICTTQNNNNINHDTLLILIKYKYKFMVCRIIILFFQPIV